MTDLTLDDRLGIGGNKPPLAEVLIDSTASLKKRTEELLESFARMPTVTDTTGTKVVSIQDDETAAKATILAKLINEHAKQIEETRQEHVRPIQDDERTVNHHFQSLMAPLAGATTRQKGGALKAIIDAIDAYRRRKEAAAEEIRRKLEAQAAEARAAAEAAREQGGVASEITAAQQTARAEALERKASGTVADPIKTEYGVKAIRRTVWKCVITDIKKAVAHCLKIDEASIKEAAQGIYDRQVRAGIRTLPGASITQDSATTIS